MSTENPSDDKSDNDAADESTDNRPNYNGLEDLVQQAQDALDNVDDLVFGHDDAIDTVDEALEETEDVVDEAQDTDNPDLLSEADAYIDDAQATIRHLEDAVDYTTDTEALTSAMNGLDNAVEDVEDALERERDSQLLVEVNQRTFVPEEFVMEPSEILQTAGFDQADYLLYHGPDAEEDDPHIEKDTEVDLRDHHVFTAIPDETGYGGATSGDQDDGDQDDDLAELSTGFAHEVRDLRDDYDVDVIVNPEDDESYTYIIIRDIDIPSDGFNNDTTDTLIRVPDNYPNQAPDWVYVDEDLRLADGSMPKKGNLHENHRSQQSILEGWLSLSWHISKLDGVEWVPYQTDLRWYLDTIVRGRLRTGE
jgi:hypothetical protein